MNYVEKYHETLKARDVAMSRGDLFMMHAKEIQLRFLRKRIGLGGGPGGSNLGGFWVTSTGNHETEIFEEGGCTRMGRIRITCDADAFA